MVAARALPAAPAPLRLGGALSARDFSALRRRAVFQCCKWDPQVEDVSTLAPFPLWLTRATWGELARVAGALHTETLALERALLDGVGARAFAARARELALPATVRRALAPRSWLGRKAPPPSCEGPRVMRFDFHPTAEGWRVSEVNCDVPGGYVEASGVTGLFASALGASPTGDPAGALVDALASQARGRGAVALVHATGYADDRQVMEYLARRFAERQVRAALCAPDHLQLVEGRARLDGEALGALMRFFPAEWLAHLPSRASARAFFRGMHTPATNPGACLLVQSKRLPLLWDELGLDLPMWRAHLPETCDLRAVPSALQDDAWVIKPALGRVGADVALAGATAPKERGAILRAARRHPRHFVAQRRFDTMPLAHELGTFYPCLGVFTLDGVAVGTYGRLATTPLVDHRAQDVAVLIDPETRSPQ